MPLPSIAFIYFAYFAIYASSIPFLARFVESKGISLSDASWVMVAFVGVNVVAPFIFSKLSDKNGRRMLMVRISALIMLLLSPLFFIADSLVQLILLYGVFGIFVSAALPQIEAVCLYYIAGKPKHYGWIRAIGSLGFLAFVWIIGVLIDKIGIHFLPWINMGILMMFLASTFLLKDQVYLGEKTQQGGESVFTNKAFIILLFGVLFWQISLAPFNTYFDTYIGQIGYSAGDSGWLIAIGVACEIGLFLVMSRWMSLRFYWLILGAGTCVLRWTLVAFFPEHLWVLMLSQTLHATSFALFHGMVILQIGAWFKPEQQGMALGLYASFGIGMGLIIGNYSASVAMLMQQNGAFLMAIFAGLVATLLMLWSAFLNQKPQGASA